MDDETLFRSVTARAAPEEEGQVAGWLAASPGNAARLDELVDVLLLTADADDRLTFGPTPTGDAMLSGRGRKEAGRGRSRAWRGLLLAAAAVAAVAVAIPVAERFGGVAPPLAAAFGSDEFTTETKPATVGLRDGTVVRLAPATRLRVHERAGAREVSLTGRGYFAVTHDPAAPFTIRGGGSTVTVLGTRFDLAVTGDDLRLIVIEGRVRLSVRGSDVEVRAGQMAQVLAGNLVPPIDVPDPEALVDWVGNFIVFQDTPLRTVAREIEQRHGVRIEFSTPELENRTVSALFAGRSFEEIAEVLCVVTQVRCTTTGNVLRMEPSR